MCLAIRDGCQHVCDMLHPKHFKSTKVEYVMFSQFKQIRAFTTSLNLNVPIKPPITPAGHQYFDITRTVIPQFNNPAVAHR